MIGDKHQRTDLPHEGDGRRLSLCGASLRTCCVKYTITVMFADRQRPHQ